MPVSSSAVQMRPSSCVSEQPMSQPSLSMACPSFNCSHHFFSLDRVAEPLLKGLITEEGGRRQRWEVPSSSGAFICPTWRTLRHIVFDVSRAVTGTVDNYRGSAAQITPVARRGRAAVAPARQVLRVLWVVE